jgi:hypothetical protein
MLLRVWNSFARQFFPPLITHFTGNVKPWHYGFADKHPARETLMAFLRASPWPSFLEQANRQAPFARSTTGGPQHPLWVGEGLTAFMRYISLTPFADVEQGITHPVREMPRPAAGGFVPSPRQLNQP